MRVKNEVILAKNGEERINSTSRECLDCARILDDLEQVHRRVGELSPRRGVGGSNPLGDGLGYVEMSKNLNS